jgi:NAD(P)-dependent dehydrogenase (short-subunit alcohol dehydrogenase family)
MAGRHRLPIDPHRPRRTTTTMTRLQGKVALVTGGSRGIGRAIAERLGRDGADVVLTYAGNHDKAEAVAAAIRAGGVRALTFQSDLSQVSQTRALFAAVLEQFGHLDIVVNNVGVSVFVIIQGSGRAAARVHACSPIAERAKKQCCLCC